MAQRDVAHRRLGYRGNGVCSLQDSRTCHGFVWNGAIRSNHQLKQDNTMKDLFDYDVYDRSGEKVGSVEHVWADEGKEIEFIGVRTGWLGFGKTHLIPAEEFTIDEEAHAIRVPYDEELIKGSPSFESDEELGERVEADVYSHFGLAGHHHGRYAGTDQQILRDDDEFTSVDEDEFTNRTDSQIQNRDRDYTEGESVDIPLMEESLDVEKRDRNLGEVRLRKVVRTETVNQPLDLQREDVIVERVAGGNARPGEDAFTEQVVSIPIREEEAVINKNVENTGSVQARKVVGSEHESVQETVRKEDVEVERTDDLDRVDRLNRE